MPDGISFEKSFLENIYLLDKSVMRGISAQFHIRSVGSGLESGLRHLQGVPLGPDGLLQALDVLLLVVDLLHGLAQVGLELVVGVSRLGDALLEGHVGVVPVRPHLIGALGDQIVHLAPEPLTGRPRGYKNTKMKQKALHSIHNSD